jgi:hypothetical protein
MALTTPQITTLKAAIAANVDPDFVALRDAGATGAMADWYNVAASPVHAVWGTAVSVNAISDAIDFSAMTPNGTPDNTATFTNRTLVAQTKQMNLQLMLQGREVLNCTRARVRSSLLDAVTNLPTGNNGNLVSAGGTDGARVMQALTRPATRGEQLFTNTATTTGTVSAFRLTFEGAITDADIVLALAQ